MKISSFLSYKYWESTRTVANENMKNYIVFGIYLKDIHLRWICHWIFDFATRLFDDPLKTQIWYANILYPAI